MVELFTSVTQRLAKQVNRGSLTRLIILPWLTYATDFITEAKTSTRTKKRETLLPTVHPRTQVDGNHVPNILLS